MNETREKILDAAERLIGENGYGATSLRHIIAEAGVNLAAIHYHFGSKEDLLDQIIVRKGGPVNAERLAMLDQLEREAQGKPVELEKITEAFLSPPMLKIKKSPEFVKLMGRIYGEGLMPQLAARHFQIVARRFFAALGRALPELTPGELALRTQFMVGAMSHMLLCNLTDSGVLTGAPVPRDPHRVMRELVVFLCGGLRASDGKRRTKK